jgi:hypothetical protein
MDIEQVVLGEFAKCLNRLDEPRLDAALRYFFLRFRLSLGKGRK